MWRRWMPILALALATACSTEADPARIEQADQAYRQIVAGDTDAFLASADPRTFDPDTAPQQLLALRDLVPAGPVPEARPVRWSHAISTEGERYDTVQEYDYPDHVVRLSTVQSRGARWRIEGVHIQAATDSELAAVSAIVTGKSGLQLALLAIGVLILGLCVITPIVALWRRRWWWAIFSAIGVGALRIDWYSGVYQYALANIQLFGVGFLKGGSAFDPWVFTLSFPLGAMLFWTLGRWKPKSTTRSRSPRQPGEFA